MPACLPCSCVTTGNCHIFLCSVWYLDRHEQRQPAIVVAVDVMHPPPSYCIRLEGADSTRDTEEARLEPRAAQPLPKPAQSAPDAKSAAAKPEGSNRPSRFMSCTLESDWYACCLHCGCETMLRQMCTAAHSICSNNQPLNGSYSCRH